MTWEGIHISATCVLRQIDFWDEIFINVLRMLKRQHIGDLFVPFWNMAAVFGIYSTFPGLSIKWTGRRMVTDRGTKCAWVIHNSKAVQIHVHNCLYVPRVPGSVKYPHNIHFITFIPSKSLIHLISHFSIVHRATFLILNTRAIFHRLTASLLSPLWFSISHVSLHFAPGLQINILHFVY